MKNTGLLFVICMLVLSCKDNTVQPSTTSASLIPLTVGSTWKYDVLDTVNHERDTVSVTIVGTAVDLNGNRKTLWQFKSLHETDTNSVIQLQDSLLFVDSSQAPAEWFVIVFPLAVGNTWKSRYISTFTILSKDTVVCPAGTFAGAFAVAQDFGIPNDLSHTYYWVQEGVGIVRIRQYKFVTVQPSSRADIFWTLISFSVAT